MNLFDDEIAASQEPCRRGLNVVVDFFRYGNWRIAYCAGVGLFFALAAVQSRGDAQIAAQPVKPLNATVQRAAKLIRNGREDDAIVLLERLTAQFPADPVAYNELAVLYVMRDDLERARAVLLAAIEAEPRYATVYRNLQSVFGALAARAYDRALQGSTGERQLPALSSFVDRTTQVAALEAATTDNPPALPARQKPAGKSGPEAGSTSTPAVVLSVTASKDLSAQSSAQHPVQLTPQSKDSAAGGTRAKPFPPSVIAKVTEHLIAAGDPDEIVAVVRSWAEAWSKQDVSGYLAFYGHHFNVPGGKSRAGWNEQRRQRLERPKFIKVAIRDVDVEFVSADRVVASFVQDYRSNTLSSKVTKVLRLSRNNGEWKIIKESVRR